MRFGGAPDAPDAFLLGFQNHVKNTPYCERSVFWSYFQEERVSDALPNAPKEKRRVDDAGSAARTPPRKASFSYPASALDRNGHNGQAGYKSLRLRPPTPTAIRPFPTVRCSEVCAERIGDGKNELA